MVFSSVLTSSPGVSAVDMGGTMDNGNNMPPPEDAPATTDALTAGGGSDNDDDEDDNDDNSGGSQDDDDKDDNDKDDDNDNEPAIPKDAPATSDALTAKKLECPPGQEVALFSTTCEPAGSTDGTQGTTSAATVCPTSPTPTSYSVQDKLSITNTVWGFTNNHQIKTEERDTQQTLLHRVATPIDPPLKAKDLVTNPGLRAICTGKQVSVTNPDGTKITYSPRTGKVAHAWVFDKGSGAWTWNYFDDVTGKLKAESKFTGHGSTRYQYDPNGRLEESWASGSGYFTRNTYDPETGKLKETERRDQTGWTTKTTFDTNSKLIKQTKEPPEWAKQQWPTQ